MSTHCQSLESAMRKRVHDLDLLQGQYQSYSSSPPRSSSPLSTPHSSRHYQRCAYIRSSPGITIGRALGSDTEETQEDWSQNYSSWKSTSYIRRRVYGNNNPLTSDYDPFEFSEDPRRRTLYSEHSQDIDDTRASSHSDSDEESDDIFGSSGSSSYRTTFFSTSAERGLWQNDPVPPKKYTIQLRTSAPSLSGVATPTALNSRTVSEPAPTTSPAKTMFYPAKTTTDNPNALYQPAEVTTLSCPQSLAASFDPSVEDEISSHTLPSLTTDRESSEVDIDIEVDEGGILSPLPPSSPPFSPLSRSISILSRSSSPFSFSYMRSSSPLSDLPDDFDDQGSYDGHENNFDGKQSDGSCETNLQGTHSALFMTYSTDLELSCHENGDAKSSMISPKPQLSFSPKAQVSSTLLSSIGSTESDLILSRQANHSESPSRSDHESISSPRVVFPTSLNPYIHESRESAERTNGFSDAQNNVATSDANAESCLPSHSVNLAEIDDPILNDIKSDKRLGKSTLKDKNGVLHRSGSDGSYHASTTEKLAESAKAKKGSEQKKRKVGVVVEKVESSSKKIKKRKVECKKRGEREDEENDQDLGIASSSHQKKRKRMEGDVLLTKRVEPKRRFRASSAHDDDIAGDDIPLDSETKNLYATICGMVIETIATSRASSLPVSSIYKLVMNSQPALKSQRPEDEWLRIFERVLRLGAGDRGSGVFGKVESSGKDRADRPLEAQWFYVPERDEDQERAALVRSLMPRPGKRTETMKYKQYYWRPLDKISKWDPEDEL